MRDKFKYMLFSPASIMIVKIVHVTGDTEDIYDTFHNPTAYQLFLHDLRGAIKKVYNAGASIIYRPNLKMAPAEEAEYWITPASRYKERFPELKKKFPFLEGLEEVVLTLLPDGWIPPLTGKLVKEVDKIIQRDTSRIVIVGGKYMQACVAAKARDLTARHPSKKVFIGYDISFQNQFPPIKEYEKLPLIGLESVIKNSSFV